MEVLEAKKLGFREIPATAGDFACVAVIIYRLRVESNGNFG